MLITFRRYGSLKLVSCINTYYFNFIITSNLWIHCLTKIVKKEYVVWQVYTAKNDLQFRVIPETVLNLTPIPQQPLLPHHCPDDLPLQLYDNWSRDDRGKKLISLLSEEISRRGAAYQRGLAAEVLLIRGD